MARTQLRGIAIAVAAGIVLLLLAPAFFETYTLTVLIIYAILALSLGLVWGFGGVLCFGQAAFFGLGAYTYAVAALNIGESTLPMLAGILVPFLFAALLGAVMFYGRLSDVYLGVVTLVVTLIFYRFVNATAGPEYVIGSARLGGFNGIPGFQTLNVPGYPDWYVYGDPYYYFCGALLLAVYVCVRFLIWSPFGRVAVATRENEQRVELMGYDPRLRKTVLFAIGGAIAGLAGTLFASWAEIVTPDLFSLRQSAEIIIWCIVGGMGTLIGPIAGAIAIGYLKFVLGQQIYVESTLVLGLILVLAVLLLPQGIVPALKRLLDLALRGRGGKRRAGGAVRGRARRLNHV